LLINEFEHTLFGLKNDDCVWGPVHGSVGQEAVAAGAIAALRKTDKVLATHRSHHHFLAKTLHYMLPKGWNPTQDELPQTVADAVKKTMAEIMGLALGWCGGHGGSMHLRNAEAGFLGSNAIVGGGIPISIGAAYTEKFKKTGDIVVCFFGDGAVNQGSFHEALNLASLWKLPIIFLLENNLYAVGTNVEQASAIKELGIRASSYGMDGHIVDGNDPIVVLNVVRQASEGVRKGEGPCLIEAKCYRRHHHAGDQPGSAYGYRTLEEEKTWCEKEAAGCF
ncbi:unnamed protein product, partial [marine sediment metagenome]